MKIKMQGRATDIKRGDEYTSVTLSFTGKVLNTRFISAKETTMSGVLMVKTAIADDIKIGSVFTATFDDETQEERLD
jgi:hypothetical protein